MELRETWLRIFREETGAAAPEYVVMLSLVILVVLATVVFLGLVVTNLFDDFGQTLTGFIDGGGS